MDHTAVSESISSFLAQYAARTGTHNASEDAAGSTGGVVAAQLTRLMNGLAGKIDYDAFTAMITAAETVDEMDTPMEAARTVEPARNTDSAPRGSSGSSDFTRKGKEGQEGQEGKEGKEGKEEEGQGQDRVS
ncbi:hypothetical protein L1887_62983 [Cichorium endivia]|nr:hypothetical protein L1887_62983 [Cichorium endivia]